MLLSCGNKNKPQDDKLTLLTKPSKETITDVNRYLSEKDKAIIEGYGRRNKLELTLSESGFYYQIFSKGNGKAITQNSTVFITGTLNLADGTPCYTYTPDDPKAIAIARSPEITGLHIALPMLKEGAHALFIFPPNLAFGLLGDNDKVPPRATIVMNINILKVEG
jgi:FKBP-type peptidyl-prolyl cis-trans isomerase